MHHRPLFNALALAVLLPLLPAAPLAAQGETVPDLSAPAEPQPQPEPTEPTPSMPTLSDVLKDPALLRTINAPPSSASARAAAPAPAPVSAPGEEPESAGAMPAPMTATASRAPRAAEPEQMQVQVQTQAPAYSGPPIVVRALSEPVYLGISQAFEKRVQAATKSESAGLIRSVAPATAPEVENIAGLGEKVCIFVNGLEAWTKADLNENRAESLVPYINSIPLPGVHPRGIDLSQGLLVFRLERTPESHQAWIDLLGSPTRASKMVQISVGLENGQPFRSQIPEKERLYLRVFRFNTLIVTLSIFLLTVIMLCLLAVRSNLLRETVQMPDGTSRSSYSLSRTQMAYWFVLVIGSFLTIWMITGQYYLTNSVLALIGIGFGTALASNVIDSNKRQNATNGLAQDNEEIARCKARMDEIKTQLNNAAIASSSPSSVLPATAPMDPGTQAALTSEMASLQARMDALQQSAGSRFSSFKAHLVDGKAKPFFIEILSDSNGVSFHRFQMVVWSLALGVIFVYTVYENLAMPDFDSTLLGLMGISNGTYLGFKIPGK